MKKLIFAAAMALMTLNLTACKGSGDQEEKQKPAPKEGVEEQLGEKEGAEPSEQTDADDQQATKEPTVVLVAYFSASGVTAAVAKDLAKEAGADLFEIKPEKPYTEADLDWRNENSRSSVEMKDKKSRPAIAEMKKNMADYQVIYVGFPIWWDTAPTIINTFMESYDFSGKTVIPFATSGGSTIDKSCADLKEAYPKVNWKAGKLLNKPSKEDLKAWVLKEGQP